LICWLRKNQLTVQETGVLTMSWHPESWCQVRSGLPGPPTKRRTGRRLGGWNSRCQQTGALQNGWNEETDWLRHLLLHVPLQTSDLLWL
jgi:hypothetical protein